MPEIRCDAAVIERIRKINKTWIVRGGLGEDAANYLDLLEQSDNSRFHFACLLTWNVLAYLNAHQRMQHEDPKRYFYPALFYATTTQEQQQFLKKHQFTLAVVRACKERRHPLDKKSRFQQDLAPQTRSKLQQVAAVIVNEAKLISAN